MTAPHNVGMLDSRLRIVLGFACLAIVAYHFVSGPVLPLWGLLVVIILVPFFLKTGVTRVCPIMSALGVSTNKQADVG